MTRDEILAASAMPLTSPSYPKGPYRFIGREYLLIHYESDPDAIRATLPEPLEPDGNHVIFEWMKMLDSSGFGSYQESGINIAAEWNGTPCNYSAMMFLDDESPTTGGREIWGFPKKIGNPELQVIHDTLTGTLHYAEREVALGHHGVQIPVAGAGSRRDAGGHAQAQRQPEVHPRRRRRAEDRPAGWLSPCRHHAERRLGRAGTAAPGAARAIAAWPTCRCGRCCSAGT